MWSLCAARAVCCRVGGDVSSVGLLLLLHLTDLRNRPPRQDIASYSDPGLIPDRTFVLERACARSRGLACTRPTGSGACSMTEPSLNSVALAFLQQRGYRAAERLITDEQPREVKLNEMVTRDCLKKSMRCALQLPQQSSCGYAACYDQLLEWIRSRPSEQQRELSVICFPIFVHCFLALLPLDPEAATEFLQARESSAAWPLRWTPHSPVHLPPSLLTPTRTPRPTGAQGEARGQDPAGAVRAAHEGHDRGAARREPAVEDLPRQPSDVAVLVGLLREP